YLMYGYGSSLEATYIIRNNVIHSTKANATLTTSPTIDYDNNLYSGGALMVPTDDARALVGDAAFVAPTVTGPFGTAQTGPQLELAYGYAPTAGSMAVNTGLVVAGSPTQDYASAPLPDVTFTTAPGRARPLMSWTKPDTASVLAPAAVAYSKAPRSGVPMGSGADA
ncbi:hypothetical protein ACC691_36070, partial [Rhizobium johnstonii]|uniref:hypothetical protein n=1 Tax=Rhizobium johnstonii TaxID=3019933 RepID=UPI003F94CFA9